MLPNNFFLSARLSKSYMRFQFVQNRKKNLKNSNYKKTIMFFKQLKIFFIRLLLLIINKVNYNLEIKVDGLKLVKV